MSLLGSLRRDDAAKFDAGKELLKLIQDPFAGTLAQTSIWASLGTSIGFTVFIALCFSFLRPYNQGVYSPKLKHADEKHAPPPIGKKPWSWVSPLWSTGETELIGHVGMDAAIFLRFIRMCRNMFLVLSVFGCAILIPVNLSKLDVSGNNLTWLAKFTPSNVFGNAHWGQVVVAWLTNLTIMGFLWWNYRKVLFLRRKYFESEEYQNSLHARTLMMYDIPKERCSDEGIARIIDEVVPSSSFSRTAIARNVKDLPNLIGQHESTVRKLEKVLAIYMKNPAQLPAARPTCRPSKKDPSYGTYPNNQKIDAIEYLTQRIKQLEMEIKEVRLSVDRRSTMPYGFASYADIDEAHNIAYACRKKHPLGATITLAPRPNDIIWDNMPLTASTRSWRRIINNLWVALLTFVWIAPNAMIAIFLVNLNNLGRVWPAFNDNLKASPTWWGIVQGIASPALMSLVYLVLPIIFRRLSIRAGDQTKTGRERHVVGKLYAFFVFNNLIVFSLFSTIWSFIAGIIQETSKGLDAWQAILDGNIGLALLLSLCQVSPFWVTWLLQRQLGAAIDLAQLWTLIYSFFMRKFSSPTPRELIELTAPPAFDYASYYNYFLFYATVALCYAGIQPLVLPAAALYFCIDVWLKKYLILYVFVTKTESGGMFWRVLFNRFIFATILANLVVFLITWVRGEGTHIQAFAVAPLPFIAIAFKFYCARAFDDRIHFYSVRNVSKHPESGAQKEQRLRSERLASRFGHPALYKPLMTPMVNQKAQATLHLVYKGRLTDGREAGSGETMSVSGYSDTYAMDAMRAGKPGKQATVPGFEFVADSQMDFEFFKNRDEFAAGHGQGDLFGRPSDIVRTGTPGSTLGGDSEYGSRPGTPVMGPLQGGMTGSRRLISGSEGPAAPQPYRPSGYRSPTGYSSPPPQPGFAQQATVGDRSRSPLYSMNNDSDKALIRNAGAMPYAAPGSASRDPSLESPHIHAPVPLPGPSTGALGGGPRGYSGLPQAEGLESPGLSDPSQYDYFRGGRNRRPGEGW